MQWQLDCDVAVPDRQALRRAFGRFATGVVVVTTRDGARAVGLTANSFSSVSLDPPLALWSLNLGSPSREAFLQAGWYAVNVLAADQAALSRRFATPAADKFAGLEWEDGLGGCPLLPGCLASFECRTERVMEAGDHAIVLGRIARARHREGEPLVFSAGRYHAPGAALAA